MKNMKKVLAVTAVAAMTAAMMPTAVFAEQLRAIFSILYSVCSFNRHDYSCSVLCY